MGQFLLEECKVQGDGSAVFIEILEDVRQRKHQEQVDNPSYNDSEPVEEEGENTMPLKRANFFFRSPSSTFFISLQSFVGL